MLELDAERLEVYLLPGEFHLARKPTIIRTLLGSCVGVTFWSEKLGLGALSHSLLPRCASDPAPASSLANGHRYVDFAIRDLARQLDELGVRRSEVQVKLFGGADVLVVSDAANLIATVGKLNCQAALEVIEAEGFKVIASSLGGTVGRNIEFDTGSGEVWLRWLG
ncbi:MAG: chemotaxis protein CheD [Terriglobales bacterium]